METNSLVRVRIVVACEFQVAFLAVQAAPYYYIPIHNQFNPFQGDSGPSAPFLSFPLSKPSSVQKRLGIP